MNSANNVTEGSTGPLPWSYRKHLVEVTHYSRPVNSDYRKRKCFREGKKCGEDAVDIPAAVQLKRFVL